MTRQVKMGGVTFLIKNSNKVKLRRPGKAKELGCLVSITPKRVLPQREKKEFQKARQADFQLLRIEKESRGNHPRKCGDAWGSLMLG